MGEIVQSLFGPSPDEIRMQQMQAMDAQSRAFAQMTPQARATYGISQGAGMLGGQLAESMGMVNPAMQQAQQRNAALQGLDVSNPQSILQRASQIQDPRLKTQLIMLAQQQQAAIDESKLKQAQAAKALREQEGSKAAPKEVEVGVAGKPGWVRKVLVDEAGNEIYSGEPYQSSKVSDGGMRPSDELRWMNQHSKDYESSSATIDTSTDAIRKTVSIKNDPKFGYLFGGYTEKALSKMAPSDIAGLQSNIDSLKDTLKVAGLATMRAGGGVGAITEKEWVIFERLVASLDQKMDEKTARIRLDEIQSYFDRAKERAATGYQKKWGKKTDFYDPEIAQRAKTSTTPTNGGWAIRPKK